MILGIFSLLMMFEKWNHMIDEENDDGWIHIPAECYRNEGGNYNV